MNWVRIHPMIHNWPGGGPPPTFDISADENGSVVVELAWDPQALSAPSGSYHRSAITGWECRQHNLHRGWRGQPQHQHSCANYPAHGNRVTWSDSRRSCGTPYVQESLKSLNSPPTTTFSRNLYYRVRATPQAAAQAQIGRPTPL